MQFYHRMVRLNSEFLMALTVQSLLMKIKWNPWTSGRLHMCQYMEKEHFILTFKILVLAATALIYINL